MTGLELRGIAGVLSSYLPQDSRPVMISPVSPGNSKEQFAAAGGGLLRRVGTVLRGTRTKPIAEPIGDLNLAPYFLI
jgi:hypothetical protein